jgi:hypothetical protein
MALTNGLLGIARPLVACRVMAGLRFGIVSESVRAGRAWLDFARQVEDSGIDVLLLRDHFSAGPFGQQLAPFSGLAAAAAVTTRLRHRGGLVPAGVRRGRDRVRFGRPAARAAGRVARHHQAAAGRDPGPPCGRVLPDRRARPRRSSPPPAGRAGDRFGDLEISALGTFIVTGERRAATEDLIARRGWSGIEAETVWGMPTSFIGSPDQIRLDLLARRERFGLSYLVVGEDSQPALAEIISGL